MGQEVQYRSPNRIGSRHNHKHFVCVVKVCREDRDKSSPNIVHGELAPRKDIKFKRLTRLHATYIRERSENLFHVNLELRLRKRT
jgi:hypothetical protein